jgi:glycosyltransferase involved in cell wall biosynthesis
MQASIVICTCNRANSLHATLISLLGAVSPNISTELIVVDNGSSDDTPSIVQQYVIPGMEAQYLYEPKRGQVYARNTALTATRGEVILFIDDDVRPAANWLEGMCGPILSGCADAVAGGVTIPPHLDREWMTFNHRAWLASTEWLTTSDQLEMVGANMAFSATALNSVPQFDPELGPGALGFGDDSLFSWQLVEAGLRMEKRLDVSVEHHFDPSRLSRSNLLGQARARGQSQAYLAHHWMHQEILYPRMLLAKRKLKLAQLRAIQGDRWKHDDGMPEWEMLSLRDIHFYKQYLAERRRSTRCYERRGLVKLCSSVN